MKHPAFTPDVLLAALPADVSGYVVAYSGGLDSHALLHALAALRPRLPAPVGAVHVHHGLQAAADDWVRHCRRRCEALALPCSVLHVDATAAAGESPEAAARSARYQALAEWLPAGHALLLAHHQDDQAETLLLQLLRGGGVDGLAAMPAQAAFGAGQLLRPLLNISRAALQHYAAVRQLDWVEDPSNTDLAFDRNFLRQRVVPLLRERWPALSAGLSRSAAHCAEASGLLGEMAHTLLPAVAGRAPGTLSAAAVIALPAAQRALVLRGWLKQATGQTPSQTLLAHIQRDVIGSRVDATPCVRWGRYRLRRYRDDVYCLPDLPASGCASDHRWALVEPLPLPAAGGVLTATAVQGAGLRRDAIGTAGVRVSWRRGGERCRPVGHAHHRPLKKLFQHAGIPPWERDRIPLIYLDDALAAVPGLWVCQPFQAGPAEPGVRIDWQR